MVDYQTFAVNLKHLRTSVELICAGCKRSASEITILPVTKGHEIEIIEYVVKAGLGRVGENYLQEALHKVNHYHGRGLKWDFIGHLQSNKVGTVVQHFDCIQSVDTESLARRIDFAAEQLEKTMSVFMQVNVLDDPQKHGVSVAEAPRLLEALLKFKHLKVEGLMTIPPLEEDIRFSKKTFEGLRELRDELQKEFKVSLPQLSMGMSHDFKEAIEAGSTMIRVGSLLFGPRN